MRDDSTNKLVLLLLAAAAVSFYVGYASTTQPAPQATPTPRAALNSVTVPLIAVDADGEGVLAELTVDVTKGKGDFFIGGKSSPIVNADTQASFKTAFQAAQGLTSVKEMNAFYSFSTDSEAVGGRSAGAAAVVATAAAFEGKRLSQKMVLTGTVEADGSIGPVGKILAKAKALKKDGTFTTFLVPPTESKETVLFEECTEKVTANSVFRQCFTSPRVVDVANETGLNIIEVSNVRQAYELMTKAG